MSDADVRSYQIASEKDELAESNREIWKQLQIKQSDHALFFPAPNALVPLMFARFMNKRKVTFVDWDEINVSTLLTLATQMKLSNVTVKLASQTGKFPVADNAFEVVFSDWGLASFFTHRGKSQADVESFAKELVRIAATGGRVAALEENGAPVMYPCPPEIVSIRSKIDAPKAEKLIMGRRIYGLFKASNLKRVTMKAYSSFLISDDKENMKAELTRRISVLENSSDSYTSLGVTVQETEKYKSWLRAQMNSNSFLIQFNSILTIGEK